MKFIFTSPPYWIIALLIVAAPTAISVPGLFLHDPVASWLTINGGTKNFDVLLYLSLIGIAVGASLFAQGAKPNPTAKVSLEDRPQGPSPLLVLSLITTVTLTPMLTASAPSIIAGHKVIVHWLAILVPLWVYFGIARRSFWRGPGYRIAAATTLLGLLISGIGFHLAFTKLGLPSQITIIIGCTSLIGIIFLEIQARTTDPALRLSRLSRFSIFSHIGYPFLLLHLLPGSYFVAEQSAYWPEVLISFVALACAAIIYIGFRRKIDLRGPILPAVICVAVFFQGTPVGPGNTTPGDDFHFGEEVLPFDQLWNHGKIPFVDIAPIHGLSSLANGSVNSVVFQGNTATYQTAQAITSACLGIVLGLLCYFSIGGWAAIAVACIPIIGGHGWAIALSIPTIVLVARSNNNELKLLTLLFLPIFGVLWNPTLGVGISFGCAALYFGLWSTWLNNKTDIATLRRAHLRALLPAIAVLLPGLSILVGLFRFLHENGLTNLWAHGLPLSLDGQMVPRDPAGIFDSPVVFQAVRWSWMAFFAFTVAALSIKLKTGIIKGRATLELFRVQVGLLLFLAFSIPAWGYWTIGRIDPGDASRAGSISLVTIGVAATFVITLVFHASAKTLVPLAAIVALVLGAKSRGDWAYFLPEGNVIQSRIQHPVKPGEVLDLRLEANAQDKIPTDPNVTCLVDGHMIGLPGLGIGLIASGRLRELQAFSSALRTLIPQGTPWLDLTNMQARYAYLGDPAPTLYPALFNAVNGTQQRRIIKQLEASTPLVVDITTPKGIAFDGALVSLRSYFIYSWCMRQYEPIQVGDYSFLVLPGVAPQVPRIANNQRAAWFGRLFNNGWNGTCYDLKHLPETWGRSDSLMSHHTTGLANFSGVEWAAIQAATQSGQSTFSVADESTFVEVEYLRLYPDVAQALREGKFKSGREHYDLFGHDEGRTGGTQRVFPALEMKLPIPIEGRDADVLSFEIQIPDNTNPEAMFDLRWTSSAGMQSTPIRFNAGHGRVVIPLGAFPEWSLSSNITAISLWIPLGSKPNPKTVVVTAGHIGNLIP